MRDADVRNHEISMSVDIEASAEEVWNAAMTEDAAFNWFEDIAHFEPREGGRIEFEGLNGDEPYRLTGQITEFVAPERLTFEWNWEPEPAPAPTLVSIELSPADSGPHMTCVTLRHHGFDQLPDDIRDATFAEFEQRWDGDELIPLKQYVEGIGPSY